MASLSAVSVGKSLRSIYSGCAASHEVAGYFFLHIGEFIANIDSLFPYDEFTGYLDSPVLNGYYL